MTEQEAIADYVFSNKGAVLRYLNDELVRGRDWTSQSFGDGSDYFFGGESIVGVSGNEVITSEVDEDILNGLEAVPGVKRA